MFNNTWRGVILLLIAVVMLALTPDSLATPWYVRKKGSDSNDGRSAGAAFLTVGKAFTVVQAGDIVYIGKGTYTENVTTPRSGSAGNMIRIVADKTGAFTGDKKGTICIKGSSGSAALTLNKDYWQFETIYFRGSGSGDGVTSSGASNVFQTCTFRYGDDGISITGGSVTITGGTFRNTNSSAVNVTGNTAVVDLSLSTIYPTGGDCILVSGTSAAVRIHENTIYKSSNGYALHQTGGNVDVINCVIRNNKNGVYADTGSISTDIWNNTFSTINATCVNVRAGTVRVHNNIFSGTGTGLSLSAGTLTHGNNLYWSLSTSYSGVTAAPTDLAADPKFASSSSWTLASTSPAIDAGTNASTYTSIDRSAVSRPQLGGWDMGAYERTVAPATIPYFTDFASGVGTGWSRNVSTTNATLGQFTGPFSNDSQSLMLTTVVDMEYTIIFDLYVFDAWDGDDVTQGPDFLNVTAAGDVALRETFSNTQNFSHGDWPDVYNTDVNGNGIGDSVYRKVVCNFTASDTVTAIVWQGSGLAGVASESWGIDNVRVVTTATEGAYVPAYLEVGSKNGFDNAVATTADEGASTLWADFNNDGTLDSLQTGSTPKLMRGEDGGGSFIAGTMSAVAVQGQTALVDLNNDGWVDAWSSSSTSSSTERAFANNAGAFSNAGALGFSIPSINDACAAADVNNDGWADIAMFSGNGNYVALNQQVDAATLAATPYTMPVLAEDSTTEAPLSSWGAGDGNSMSSSDVNNDGILDFFYHYSGGMLFLSSSTGYAKNNRGISMAASSGTKVGSAWADYNNDGWPDLIVCDSGATSPVALWKSPGASGNFTNATSAAGLSNAKGFVSACWGDYNNDGYLDLFCVSLNGQCQLYQNSGSPNYTFTATDQGTNFTLQGSDAVFVDYDCDGQLDLAMSAWGTNNATRLFSNGLSSANYLLVRPNPRSSRGTNRAAIGTRIEVWNTAGTTLLQRREIGVARGFGCEPLWAHFGGLNANTNYTVKVYYRNGTVTQTVKPSSATTTVGVETIAQMVTIDEPASAMIIGKWQEVGQDDAGQ